ncbi:hypothetical protein [Mangrovicoccus ximenensis]|nr:hypothetical protein [Mangrovicoccus ximenensis]
MTDKPKPPILTRVLGSAATAATPARQAAKLSGSSCRYLAV